MIDRDYMLNRLRSRSISKRDFNYEILSAPPIYSMFTPEDIQQLHYYASSAKYTAKLREKYEAIDRIMTNRGFQKLVAGTNRVSYIPTFANNFIVKVAYDTVALKDSIREYKNQYLLKPFCTKVFEVTPCGTLGVFERVNPVTSIKEYISMAADIFRLLNDFVIGEYIIDDIGTNYYQNIGYRNGFGPVILDFPYVYEVDPKKIWCNKPDHNDPTGYCNGPIDYDGGFNKLKCRKCGAVYKPFEIAKKIEYNPQEQLIMESEEKRMKIRISGGSLGNGKMQEIVTGDFQSPVTAIRSNKLNKKVEKELKKEQEAEEEAAKTVNGVAEPKKEESEEEKKPEKIISPFSINEEDVGKGDLGYEVTDNEIEKILSEVNNIYYREEDSDKRKKIIAIISTYLLDLFADQMDETMKMIAKIFKKKSLSDAIIKEFLDDNSCSVNNQFIKLLLTSDNYYISSQIDGLSVDENTNSIVFKLDTSVFKTKTDKVVVTPATIDATISTDEILNHIGYPDASNETLVAQESEIDFYASDDAEGLELVDAEIIAKKDLFPSEKKGKVIVIKNNDGKYLTINAGIVAIDKIDERNVRDITIVPKDWYEDAIEIIDQVKKAPVGSLPEDEEVEEEEVSGEEE